MSSSIFSSLLAGSAAYQSPIAVKTPFLYPDNSTPRLDFEAYKCEETFFTTTLSVPGTPYDPGEDILRPFSGVIERPSNLVGLGITGVGSCYPSAPTLFAPVQSISEVEARRAPLIKLGIMAPDANAKTQRKSAAMKRPRWFSDPPPTPPMRGVGPDFYENVNHHGIAIQNLWY